MRIQASKAIKDLGGRRIWEEEGTGKRAKNRIILTPWGGVSA